MPAAPVLRQAILKALKSKGPLTYKELSETTGRSRQVVRDCIIYARKSTGTDLFKVVSWGRNMRYAAGPGPDAERSYKTDAVTATVTARVLKPASPFSGLGGVL